MDRLNNIVEVTLSGANKLRNGFNLRGNRMSVSADAGRTALATLIGLWLRYSAHLDRSWPAISELFCSNTPSCAGAGSFGGMEDRIIGCTREELERTEPKSAGATPSP